MSNKTQIDYSFKVGDIVQNCGNLITFRKVIPKGSNFIVKLYNNDLVASYFNDKMEYPYNFRVTDFRFIKVSE